MRQVISREVAIVEVWLDEQTVLNEPSFPKYQRERTRLGVYGIVGTALGIVGMFVLIVEYWRFW